MDITITKSKNKDKKFDAIIDGKKRISFGDSNYSDFTKHKDEDRKKLYINRHKKREDWTKSGIDTAGFYSKHVLWGEPTIEQSIDKLNKRYKNIEFTYKR